MENGIKSELTQQKREILLAFSAIEIIEKYCELTLQSIEKEIGMPIHINVHKLTTTKPHQDIQTSLKMSMIIGKLKSIGEYYSKVNHSNHVAPFDYGVKLFLQHITESHRNDLFSDMQLASVKKLINEYIFDDLLKNINSFFLVGHDNIPQYEMLFLLHEFAYQSPIHTAKYNFQGDDIRRTTIGRIELITMNKYQDQKLNINNIENQLFDGITNFTYNIVHLVDIMFTQKEVQYRTSLLNEIYFNFEHFLSVIIKTFKITDATLGKKPIKNKQDYLSKVFDELNINHHIEYKSISNEIQKRCSNSSNEYLNLLISNTSKKIPLIDVFLQLINMRNSLHSNGASNKDINSFNIGNIHFPEAKKDRQFSSMAMHQLIALMVVATYTMEIIIEKLSAIGKINGVDVPKIMIDKYLEDKQEFEEQHINSN